MSASITTACSAGDDPLSSFLIDVPPADALTTSFSISDAGSRPPLWPPAQNDVSIAVNDHETVATVPLETFRERASRLLAMCDERGVGTTKGTRPPSAVSLTLQNTSRGVDGITERSPGSDANPRCSLKTSRVFAQLLLSPPSRPLENSKDSLECNGGGALFHESVTSLESKDDTQASKKSVGAGDTSACDISATLSTQHEQSRSLDKFISTQLISDGNNIDVDDLLRCNGRLEDEVHRLRTLLTKRTLVLEEEKRQLSSELSHIRDAHREELERVKDQSQYVVANLMSRTEELKRSMKDRREMFDALTAENHQLRLDNHYFRMKESGRDGGDCNNSGYVNTTGYGWLLGYGWGGGRKAKVSVSSPPESTRGGELHGLATTKIDTG
jgi:hypothetical protein